jgi:hypothetical protein
VTCGHYFLLFGALGLLPTLVLFWRLQVKHPKVLSDLGWNRFFDAGSLTPKSAWFLLFGHWRKRDLVVSLMCIATVIFMILGVLSFFQSSWICSGGFRID